MLLTGGSSLICSHNRYLPVEQMSRLSYSDLIRTLSKILLAQEVAIALHYLKRIYLNTEIERLDTLRRVRAL